MASRRRARWGTGPAPTHREVTVLAWMAEQYAVRADTLGLLLGRLSPESPRTVHHWQYAPGQWADLPALAEATVRYHLRRWHRVGWVRPQRALGRTWIIPTRVGLELAGTWTDPTHDKMTFAAWLEAWWETAADLRPSTRARDRSYFNSMVLPRFGTTPLAAIKQRDVQAWVADLRARGFAPATVVKAYQLLGRTMTAAVNADLIARSPCRAVRLPKVEREESAF
jgi:Phage integrase, N-terminal SAM-like domain